MRNSHDLSKPSQDQTQTENESRNLKRVELAFWLMAFLLGFIHVWSDHHYVMNADAMSYLDIAEAYLRRDWQAAVSSYWSPLYSWIIAAALAIVRPSPYWKFAVVHIVNFAIYLFALGCFSFLIHEAVHRIRSQRAELLAAGLVTLPDWALLAIGYSLFIWSSIFLVTIRLESPDMLVAAFVYLATGIVLRIRRDPSKWLPFIVLGIVLGVGYLGKSVMLPLTIVFLIAALFSAGLRRGLPRVLVAVAFFLLIAGPFVFVMSRDKGRLVTGRSGRLNYLWSINRVIVPHWQGEEPGSGTPEHPTRKIFNDPPAFEFGEPIKGTYPVWYNPPYWYEGSVTHFDFRQQLRVFIGSVKSYYELFRSWGLQYGLFVGVVALYVMGRKLRSLLFDLAQQWPLFLPALAGCGIYALVFVEDRYVASFVVLLWLALFSAVRLHHTPNAHRFIRSITLVLVVSIMFTVMASSTRETLRTVSQLVSGEDPTAHEQWQVAEGLRELGVGTSDKVASVGDSFRAFWAHLAGVRISAEVRRDKIVNFWQADATLRSEVINAFARAGVKAVVAERPPPGIDLSGWKKLRNTDYYVYLLNQ